MSNTQTQQEYLVKQKKLFKKALNNRNWEQARSHLLRIDNMEGASPRGNIRPYIVTNTTKLPNRKERRAALQGMARITKVEQPVNVENTVDTKS